MDKLIAEKYELRTEIGRGPHGIVWRARQKSTGADCAVKVLHQQFATDAAVVDRFIHAEPVLRAFLHPAHVRVRELVIDPERLALITELVDGVDLGRRLAGAGAFPPTRAAEITAAAAGVVAAGHDAGIVHCNIKSSNVILTAEASQVRITDCRIARLVRGLGNTGGDSYAAPEVRSGSFPVRASDVYGLGIVLYEALTGSPPDPTHPAALPISTDSRLRELFARCVASSPDERMTAAQLAADLHEFAESSRPQLGTARAVVAKRSLNTSTRWPAQVNNLDAEATLGTAEVRESETRTASESDGGTSRRRGPSRLVIVRVSLLALVVSVLILAGVLQSTHDRPSTVDTASPGGQSSIPAVLSAGQPPELATAATEATAAGAIAFAYYWFDTLNYAVQSGDDEPLGSASSVECDVCASARAKITEWHRDEQRLVGGTYTVRSVQADSFFDINRPVLRVVYDRTTRSTVDAHDRILATLVGVAFGRCQLVLERSSSQWRVLDVQTTDPVV